MAQARDSAGRFISGAAAGLVYVPNPKGIEALLKSDQLLRAMNEAGDIIVDEAERNAPVGDRGFPHYVDTLGHTAAYYDPADHSAKMEVGSTDVNAALIEFGSINNPPYRTITSAAEELGLDVKDPGPS